MLLHGDISDNSRRRESTLRDRPARESTLLLVDDDEDHLILFSTFLSREGYKVICADGAKEAFAVLHGAHVDLIITDLRMPIIDGAHFITLLRNSPVWSEIPIIALAASEHDAEELVGQDEGPDSFCPKSHAKTMLPAQIRFLTR